MKFFNQIKAQIAIAAVVSVINATAADSRSGASPYLGELSAVPALELPAKSAHLVAQAEAKARTQATVEVVKTAVGLNPAAAANIVGSIAKSTPEMAPIASGTAVSLVPNQAVTIARVAAAAAPDQAGRVVEAICRVLPKQYKAVALAVAEVAPQQGKAILAGIADVMPALKAPLAKAIAGYSGSESALVTTVLDQVQPAPSDLVASAPALSTAAAPSMAGPTFGAPYVTPAANNQNLDPGSGTQVTTGGRNYAAP